MALVNFKIFVIFSFILSFKVLVQAQNIDAGESQDEAPTCYKLNKKTNKRIISLQDELKRGKRSDDNNTYNVNVKDKEETIKTYTEPTMIANFTSKTVYGGINADLGEFSWMVILEYRNATTDKLILDCSGSIINEFYVLTAAHCVQGDILMVHGKLESVRVGEHDTNTERDCDGKNCQSYERIKIDEIIPHVNYSTKNHVGSRNQHDIALIRLKEPIKFHENLIPACLPNLDILMDFNDETILTVAGWGHNGTEIRTAIKQKVVLPFVEHSKCRQIYAKKFYLADEQLCAGGEYFKDSCNGDSGGPLMRLHKNNWILEGIVSFGLGCGREKPGIYTNVRYYLDWIDEHVNSR